jgi:hypothetical protein
MEVKHVLNQLIQGQITTSTVTKSKKYLHPSLRYFAHKISIDILQFTPHKKFKSLRLSESPITQAQFQELFSVSHVST